MTHSLLHSRVLPIVPLFFLPAILPYKRERGQWWPLPLWLVPLRLVRRLCARLGTHLHLDGGIWPTVIIRLLKFAYFLYLRLRVN